MSSVSWRCRGIRCRSKVVDFMSTEQPQTSNRPDCLLKDAGRAETEITLGDDEYFVLGDNVNNSEDIRYESIGNVTRKEMIGKVWFCLSLKGLGPVN